MSGRGIVFFGLLLALNGAFPLVPFSALADREKVEARVNDTILTTSELERLIRPVYRQYEETASGSELSTADTLMPRRGRVWRASSAVPA